MEHRLPPFFLWIQLWVGDAIDCANFGTTADPKSSSAPKFAQSNHSPTANLRILEEENRGESDNSTHANAEVYPLQIIKSYELLHTRLLKITLIKIKEA